MAHFSPFLKRFMLALASASSWLYEIAQNLAPNLDAKIGERIHWMLIVSMHECKIVREHARTRHHSMSMAHSNMCFFIITIWFGRREERRKTKITQATLVLTDENCDSHVSNAHTIQVSQQHNSSPTQNAKHRMLNSFNSLSLYSVLCSIYALDYIGHSVWQRVRVHIMKRSTLRGQRDRNRETES